MHRVVVTGIGVVSPVGLERESFWSALVEGRSGIRDIANIQREGLIARVAAQVLDFDPAAALGARLAGQIDRFSQFAVHAARQALADSGVEIDEATGEETATILGNGAGGFTTIEDAYDRMMRQNANRFHPMTIPRFMVNAAGCQVSLDLGLKGPAWTVTSACASATHAIGQAFNLVRTGQALKAMTGGTEATLTYGSIKCWEALRVVSPDTCRPFSRNRSGMALGEGAAMLMLERREDALARGAHIYAEILGFGMSADAVDIIAADAGGASRAMKGALRDARLDPERIAYVNAHGTGTVLNDKTEAKAIRMTFGDHAGRLAVSSSKAVLGHSLGASGALELAATALALDRQVIPPTANFTEADPECEGLDVVPNVARDAKLDHAMSNSFAFGGLNGVIVLGRAGL